MESDGHGRFFWITDGIGIDLPGSFNGRLVSMLPARGVLVTWPTVAWLQEGPADTDQIVIATGWLSPGGYAERGKPSVVAYGGGGAAPRM